MIKKYLNRIDNDFLSSVIKIKFVVLFPLFLLHTWSLQYLNGGLPFDFVSRLSFKIEDQPWLPGGRVAEPYFGRHFFGDLNLGIGYSTFSNPFDSSLTVPNQTPPLGTLFFRIFLILGVNNVLIVFLLINLIALLIIFYLASNYRDLLRNDALYILIVTTSFPLLFLIDRGAVHLIVISLIICSLYFLSRSKHTLFLLTSILACSIKPQSFVIIFLILVYFKKYRLLWSFIFLFLITNALALHFFFEGSLLFKFKSYLFASSFYSGGRGVGYVMDSTSLIGLISRIQEFFIGSELTSKNLLIFDKFFLVPGMLYVIGLLIILKSYKYSLWLTLGLILSTFSLVLPASMTYTLVWAIPALLLFSGTGPLVTQFKHNFPFIETRSKNVNAIYFGAKAFYLLGLFYGLVFHLWSIRGPSGVERFPLGEVLNPMFLSITVFLLLVDLLKQKAFSKGRENVQ
jgi:hypothetical protein